MANQIRLKRASGSDPTASDLVLGEPAVRTDTGELFFLKDNGNVAKVSGGGGVEDGDKGDITVSNSGDTFTIDNGVVTTAKIAQDAVDFTKLQNISTNVILGRNDAGTGITKQLSTSEVRTLINVEDGATADQTASEILTLIKTVDGAGSGLDADTLDGISSASFLRSDEADTMSGNLSLHGNLLLTGSATTTNQDRQILFTGFDKEGTSDTTDHAFIRHTTNTGGHAGSVLLISSQNDSNDGIAFATNSSSYLKRNNNTIWDAGNDGSGSGLDADLLDGVQGSSFLRSDANDTATGTLTFNNHLSFPNDGDGIFLNGGGRFYKKIGTGLMIRLHTPNTQLQVENNSGTVLGTFWHSGNDGSGTGLDADLLDGVEGSSFVRSDEADTISGDITFTDSGQYPVVIGSASGMDNGRLLLRGSSDPYIRFREGNTDKAFIQWNSSGYLRLMNQEDSSVLRIKDDIEFSPDNSTYYKMWNAYNDGSGSGLDADLLDGQEGSYYRNASNLNAGTVAAARLDTATTQSAGNSTTKIATTAFVSTAIANLVDSAPGTLNTLNELAAALGDDANFSTTVTNSIATKLPLAGGSITGDVFFLGASSKTITFDQSEGHIRYLDNAKAQFGTQGDLEIYHSGSHAIINNNTGDLRIESNRLELLNHDSNEFYLTADDNGSVALYCDGTQRLTTSSSGISVTGNVIASGNITANNGTVTVSGSAPKITFTETNDNPDYKLEANGGNLAIVDTTNSATRFSVSSSGASVTGNIVASGDTTTSKLTINSTTPAIDFAESDGNPDYRIYAESGAFVIRNQTNTANRFVINSDGHIDLKTNVDCEAGLDVTGNITVSGTVDGRDVATDGSKLDGIESGATADQSASEILTLLKTVDGAGSGLDADLLDGTSSAGFFKQSGSWLGDLGSNGFTRENGLAMTGGAEFVILSKSGQGHVLIDGSYHAYEGGAFYSYQNSSFSSQIGFFADSTSSAKWKGHLKPNADSSQDLGSSSLRWSNLYADTLYGAGSNITALNASNISSGTVPAARLPQQENGTSIVGNFGQWQAHTTYNNFNTEPAYWGWNFVHGNTNAPNTTSSQWYRCRLSLGSEYGKGSDSGDYSLEMALPRSSHASSGVLHIRTIENGTEGSWTVAGSNASLITTGTLPAARIGNNAITFAKMQNIPEERLIGRVSSGSGIPEHLTQAQVRTFLGLASSATTDTTNASNISSGTIPSARLSASDLLTKIKTVDGSGSGLDADLLDGVSSGSYTRTILTDDDITGRMNSGFYESNSATTAEGWPVTSNSWYHLISSTHSNTANYYSMQIAGDFFTQDNFYIRSTNGSGTRGWSKIWTSSSDGSGSGLDSDLLDGVQGSSYLRSDTNDTFSGNLTVNGIIYLQDQIRIGDDVFIEDFNHANSFRVKGNQDNNKGFIAFGSQTKKLGCDGASAALTYDGNEVLTSASSLNASNLGSGTIPDARFPSTLPAVDGSNLTGISAGATGGGSDEIFYENGQTVTTNYTITNGKNAMCAGPITINSGVTVTVGSGENLTIV